MTPCYLLWRSRVESELTRAELAADNIQISFSTGWFDSSAVRLLGSQGSVGLIVWEAICQRDAFIAALGWILLLSSGREFAQNLAFCSLPQFVDSQRQ